MVSRLIKVMVVASAIGGAAMAHSGEEKKVVRIAQLEIDPAQLTAYQAALKEEMETSVRVEDGVISIYSVAEKDQPNKLHFFEVYASESAYESHIASPHFKKYFEATKSMILSKKLISTDIVQLSAQHK